MPSALPIADPAPLDGLLPSTVVAGASSRNFGVYLHVPFCRVRCGYCDFNTYTSDELRGAKRSDFASQAITEIALARSVLHESALPPRAASTVFFGGGTPTILPVTDLADMLGAVVDAWGLAEGAEVTDRGESGLRRPRLPLRAARRRVHQGVVRDAVCGSEGARHPRAHPRSRADSAGGAVGAGGRARR